MKLVAGKGSPEVGACWMSAIAWYAGEHRWNDSPRCVCPILRAMAMVINDGLLSNAERERVIGPVIFDLVGTADRESLKPRVEAMFYFILKLGIATAANLHARLGRMQTAADLMHLRSVDPASLTNDSECMVREFFGALFEAKMAFEHEQQAPILEHVALPLLLDLAKIGKKTDVPQVRALADLPS